ncbi:uncharacterized protein LOC117181935 [Belonocnema kinseyi]|uniref:uncharacterized protein LOC117181935 n=1 Tax=Belonocnema kinseyi TaxID=2817044 RepID=UPI00143DA96E|nr:uncharacterized protein LOC117181935 [Belonocnema kinseyi]
MTSNDEEETNSGTLRRGNSLRISARDYLKEGELIRNSQTGGSLRIPRKSDRLEEHNLLCVPDSPNQKQRPIRPTRHSAPSILPPAPEFLARNLLQLGCPVVLIPKPRSGVGTDPLQSSDSDDSTTMQSHHGGRSQGEGQGRGHSQLDSSGVPMVQISGPQDSSEPEPIIDGSAGSIGARSAPTTPLQGNVVGTPVIQQIPVSGAQLTVTGNIPPPPPPKSPSHSALKTSESQLSKPLSKSTPSMVVGGIQTSVSRTSSKSSPGMSTSSARQKKFHRHFSQVFKLGTYFSIDRLEQELFEKPKYFRPTAKPPVKSSWGGFNPGTIIAILVALLAALYVSAALMMLRIDKLHSAYVNHPLATPERFTQDRLLQYLNTNLDQIVKVRQSLQTLSQQIVSLSQGSDEASVTGGSVEPEESPS